MTGDYVIGRDLGYVTKELRERLPDAIYSHRQDWLSDGVPIAESSDLVEHRARTVIVGSVSEDGNLMVPVRVLDVKRPVRILEAEGTPRIGTALLWGSLLTAEMIDDGAVTIGPLTAGVSG